MKQYTIEELNSLQKEEVVALMVQLQKQNDILTEQLAVMQASRFGRSTERLDCLGQTNFFNEVEDVCDETKPEPEIEDVAVVAKKAKRPSGKLDKDLEGLPCREELHELSDDELKRIFGTDGWKRLPDEIYRKLEYHPATKEVVEHHIAVYASKKGPEIARAPHPVELFNHSIATPSLVAAIMNAKYTNAMPLYRIGQEFQRNGVNLSEPTMANWVNQSAGRYLSEFRDRLRSELLQFPVIQADETTCPVNKDGREGHSKSWMFVYRSGELYQDKAVIIYDYQKTRGSEHFDAFLQGYSGILVSDAYSGYHALDRRRDDIQIAHCWAHARRDFADAVKALKQKGGPGKQRIKKTIAYQALERIASIYALEEDWKNLSAEERRSRRQEHSKPLVEAYFAWAKEIDQDSVISQKTKDGLNYSIHQERYLKAFLGNGEIPIDNSASERAIRPFCVGRSNWHMIDTVKGAEASAIVYSIVETAKANNLKPYEYLKYLLTEIPKHIEDKDARKAYLDDLLPWSENLPDICKKPT